MLFLLGFAFFGVYIGRDLTILAHYNLFIAIGIWMAALSLFFLTPSRLAAWFHAYSDYFPLIRGGVILVFFMAGVLHICYWMRVLPSKEN
jgi:hypothetical protein